MDDLVKIAALITVAKRVRKMGYSPEYIRSICWLPDEEWAEVLGTLADLDMAYKKNTYDMFGEYNGTETLWTED